MLDHPAMGEVVHAQRLVDLSPYGDRLDLAHLEADTVGGSIASYRYGGGLWALPLDAACQVAAYRPDVLAQVGVAVPETLDDVHALALGGVHAFMGYLTLCANLGAPFQASPAAMLPDRETGIAALEPLRPLASSCPPEVLEWNSIAALNALSTRDDLLYSPYVYGFSSYSATTTRRPVCTGIPQGPTGSVAGSVPGGTGLAISRHCADLDAALGVALYVTSVPVQVQIGLDDGQPARRSVWLDPQLNAAYAGFYENTRPVIETSWLRPRCAGHVPFQRAAGEIVTGYLRDGTSPGATLDDLDATQHRFRSRPEPVLGCVC